jgi:hypothetical protein
MPMPEKEFQDEYQKIWARKTEVAEAIDALKVHNVFMHILTFLVILFGAIGSVVLIKLSINLNKIVKLLN